LKRQNKKKSAFQKGMENTLERGKKEREGKGRELTATGGKEKREKPQDRGSSRGGGLPLGEVS